MLSVLRAEGYCVVNNRKSRSELGDVFTIVSPVSKPGSAEDPSGAILLGK